MNTIKQLEKARDLIQAGWTRGAFARDVYMAVRPPRSPLASRFCATGACYRVSQKPQDIIDVLASLCPNYYSMREIGYNNQRIVANFNDSKKNKRDVIDLFNKAIKSLQA